MMIYNYHTHTRRCGHAYGSDEQYVQAAIRAGYKVLGFSDHTPYRWYPHESAHMNWDQLEEYIQSINHLKEKYKDQIEIRLGLESEYYPFCHRDHEMLAGKVDYMLLGQHFAHPSGVGSGYFKKNTEKEIRLYAKQACEGIRTGLYRYICHPDVIMNNQPFFTEACQEAAHQIGQACSEMDLPVELNIRGVMKGKKHFPEGDYFWYPNLLFWRILSQYDLKVVVGIDAHDPSDLLAVDQVEIGLKELESLHLNFITEPFI